MGLLKLNAKSYRVITLWVIIPLASDIRINEA